MNWLRKVWSLLKETVTEFVGEDPFTQAGALSYYTLLSFAPFLLLLIALVGVVYGEDAAKGEIVGRLSGLVGADAAKVSQDVLAHAHESGGGVLSAIVGGAFLLAGATTAFGQLQGALNKIWGVEPAYSGLWGTLRARLLGFLLILTIGAAVVALLIASSVIAALASMPGVDGLPGLWRLGDLVASFAVMTALFAVLYKLLPDATIRWRDVGIGAALTSLLFAIGRWAIGLYLGRASVGSAYGAAGSVVVLMAWVYYSTLIVLFGAELTQVYARRYGCGIVGDTPATEGEDKRVKAGRLRAPKGAARPDQPERAGARGHAPKNTQDDEPLPAGVPAR